ncbi:MAG: sulfotransferase [Spirochaetes bacterium]|nr:sulfotransferase [Spirochaetota bacterium]
MNSPVRHTSMSYSRPYRPRFIAAVNAAGRAAASFGFAGRIPRQELLEEQAARKTGLSDFGDASFRERMRLLVESIEGEARLNTVGRFIARQNLERFLAVRLRIEDALKRHPEILAMEMEDPVFIVGLQRTGTTMLQRLLAADTDRFRFLASWEAINPAPLAGTMKPGGRDPRVRMAVVAGKALRYMAPDFFAIHPVEPLEPEEDCLLFDYDFWSTVPEATMRVPSFSRWLETQDHTEAYRYYRKILQYLYWQNPTGRWILKTPQHMEHIDELLTVFPNAKIIQTHRDPSVVVASFCSMVSHAYGVFSDMVDPVEIGHHWGGKAQKMVSDCMSARNRFSADRFLDIQYADLVREPGAALRRVYEFLGVSFGPADERRIGRWTDDNPQHKHGRHVYRLEDFGLDPQAIDGGFAVYRERFDIRTELRRG